MDPSTTITNLFTALSHLSPPTNPSHANTKSHPTFTISRGPNILTLLTTPSSMAAKSIFLTLHFLFPHDLLPALDILDRQLVQRFTTTSTTPQPQHQHESEVYYIQSASAITDAHPIRNTNTTTSTTTHTFPTSTEAQPTTTAPTTSSSSRFRPRERPTETHYEVRLDSWNCTCAAFAFSALGLLSRPDLTSEAEPGFTAAGGSRTLSRSEGEEGVEVGEETEGKGEFRFGGTATRDGLGAPICKHILAACLARWLPGWAWGGDGDEGREWHREVRREEAAGWGAGWGDRG